MGKKLIFGLGTGRCGTVSLYRLLNSQNDSFFTHESKPLLPWDFDKNLIDSKLEKFFSKNRNYVGDVGSNYLPYVEYIREVLPESKFVVLKRPKVEVINSFINHSAPYGFNHWMEHDGTKWKKSQKWDLMHPKYEASSIEEALDIYWEDYYSKVEALVEKYPSRIGVYWTSDLNSKKKVKEILDFCDFEKKDRKIILNIKENKNGDFRRFFKYFWWRADKL